jgi:hypothetical protein
MRREFQVRFCERPGVQFPRATHLVLHCRSEAQARLIRHSIEDRLRACKLEAHPQKTKSVYCRDSNRTENHRPAALTFWGTPFALGPQSTALASTLLAFLLE